MTELEEYYNKFNEEKRLNSRYGQVEFITSMKYIHKYLELIPGEKKDIKIMDLGAGTGRYSIPLAEEGYDVTAVELVKHNLGRLKQKSSLVKAYQGNAMKLKRFDDNTFDLTLLFGPMYHLHEREEKLKALSEARRITKPGGYILVAYIMNEYAVISFGIMEGNIARAKQTGMLDDTYHTTRTGNPLYSMVRLEDMESLNEELGLKRMQVIAADGAASYIRVALNALDEVGFGEYIKYHLSTCERMDLMGASAHTVDILQK